MTIFEKCEIVLKYWNVSSITPINESGPNKFIMNYKCISILTFSFKIPDTFIADYLKDSFSNIFIDKQHCSRPSRSTATNLTVFRGFVTEMMDKDHQVDAI